MRIVKVLSVLAVLLAVATFAAAAGQVLLNAAGATFPYPIYSKWFDEYHKLIRTCRSTISRSVRAAESAN